MLRPQSSKIADQHYVLTVVFTRAEKLAVAGPIEASDDFKQRLRLLPLILSWRT